MTSGRPRDDRRDVDALPGDEIPNAAPTFEVGRSGLKRVGGYVQEEFLPQLSGRKAVQIYREMADNSPVIGAFLLAIERLIRQIEWRVEPASQSAEDKANAEFVEQAMADMEHSWDDMLTEIMSMCTYGWEWSFVTYKRRIGPWEASPERRSKHTDGRYGWRKIEIRSQESLLRWNFAPNGDVEAMVQMPAPDYQKYVLDARRSLLFRVTKAKNNPEGKALALDTPVPTPNGWRTMADLRVGDPVFDEQGRTRYVTATAEWPDRPTYRVTFNDKTSIVADAEHEWLVTSTQQRATGATPRGGRLATTAQILASMDHGPSNRRTGIEWAAPIQYPPQSQLVDPWVLGLWLGDGDTNGARITCHVQDLDETVRLIEGAGYPTKSGHNGAAGGLGRKVAVYGDLQKHLGVLDVQFNKHVPEAYLRGSIEPRLALLQGLMDSDGSVDAYGRCEFVNTNERLVGAVAEMVRSLGMSAHVSVKRLAGTGKATRDAYAVKFTPEAFIPFRLERKRARCISTRSRNRHYITGVEYVGQATTKCIEVDSPSHLFLAGESFIPSHNSLLRNAYSSWFYLKRFQEIEAVGVERDLTGVPIAKVPARLFTAAPGTKEAKEFDAWKQMVTAVRRNEQEGLVIPQDIDPDTKQPSHDFALLTSGGTRQFDIRAIINDYKTEMLMSVLADFMMVGHEDNGGSYALHTDKTGMFRASLNAIAKSIADVFNRDAIPRLFAINAMRPAELPTIVPNDVDPPDLTQLGAFLQQLFACGLELFPNPELEAFLFDAARLPMIDEDVEKTREIQMRQAAIIALAQQKLEGIQIEQQAAQGEMAMEQMAQGVDPNAPAGPGAPDPSQVNPKAGKQQADQGDVATQRAKIGLDTDKTKLSQEREKLSQLKKPQPKPAAKKTPVKKSLVDNPFGVEHGKATV